MSKNVKFQSPYYDELTWLKVRELLGRTPKGLHRVLKYHPKGHPAVLEVFPYPGNVPFPTLYWLCCPIWKKEISHLEKDGYIKTLESNIQADQELKTSVIKMHHEYKNLRKKLYLTYMSEEQLDSDDHKKVIFESGVGGISNFETIKCLHLQFAYYMALDCPNDFPINYKKLLSLKI